MNQLTKTALKTGIGVAAGLVGSMLLPGVGTAVGTGLAGAATGAAEGAGVAAAESAGAVGAGVANGAAKVANAGAKVAQAGSQLAEKGGATKLADGLVKGGTKVAQMGENVANGANQFATAQKDALGDFGTKALKGGVDAGTSFGMDKLQEAMQPQQNTQSVPLVQANNQFQNTASDENLKDAQLVNTDPVEAFANIDAYLYKYKPEAQAMYGDTGKVNDEQNFGVMAQELAENPLTSAAVNQDENGYLEVDGSRLSTMNTAVIGELCKRIMALEAQVYGRG